MAQVNAYEATVAWSDVQSRLAYSLTTQALQPNDGALAFALLAQAALAIEYGFAAYEQVFATAELEEAKAAAAWARAQHAAAK